MKVVVVIPSYNESATIGKLIDTLAEVFKDIRDHKCEILVVDGNSPDGTADIVREKEKQFSFVHLLLEKEKAGLGAAYIFGFKHAITELKADVLVEMDADLQHDPLALPSLLEPLNQGFDYVIGSRYIKGGSIPKEWGFHRKFLSIVGNIVAKFILGVFTVNDFTTGYKVSRVKGFVDKIDLDNVLSKGFSYKMDWLYKMHKMGAKIKEVPIQFGLREEGASKMENNNALDTLRVVITIRVLDNISFFKFLVVGTIGFITDFSLANLLRLLPIKPSISASSAALIAMFVTFMLNNKWSFSERKIQSKTEMIKKIFMYVGFSCVPIGFRFWFVGLITNLYGSGIIYYNGAILVSIILGLIWNYVIYSKIIWSKDKS